MASKTNEQNKNLCKFQRILTQFPTQHWLTVCSLFLFQVVFLTGQRLLQLSNLTGTQLGSYFGASLAVLDVNGDGHDDVAIGAPLYARSGH